MYFSLNLVPVHQWTHREFHGTDPWAGDQPVVWSVVVYRLVSESFANQGKPATPVPPDSNAVPSSLAVGIFCREHNRYRVLPVALQHLWRAGQVADEALPGLLHRTEQTLRRNDYPAGYVRRLATVYTWLFGILSLAALAIGFALMPSGTPSSPWVDPQQLTWEQWAAAPLTGETAVDLKGTAPALSTTTLPQRLPPPPGLQSAFVPDAAMLAAVLPAGQEQRLALIGGQYDLQDLRGVVVRADRVPMPPDVLATLRTRFPALNTQYLLVAGWSDPLVYQGSGNRAASRFAFWAALVTGLLTLTELATALYWRRRTQRQMREWAALRLGV